MNNTKTIVSRVRTIGGDYFIITIQRDGRFNISINDLNQMFNFDDYWCFKNSGHQKLVNYEDFLEFKYSGYIFFKKDLYDVDRILEWVGWCKMIGGIQFLHKPTPPFPPQKIIIRK